MKKHIIFTLLISLAIILLDQLSKFFISNYLQTPIKILPFFSIESAKNYGMAFGIPIPISAIIILSYILLFIIVFIAFREFNLSKKLSIMSLSFILGGALSNIIDRIARGYVIDFISIWIWPIFNLADIFITIGILSIIFFYGKMNRRGSSRLSAPYKKQ